jgi:hypothetical protein
VAKRKVEIPLPDGLVLGTLVRYYWEGYRVGRLDTFKNGIADIMPTGKGRHIHVPIEDVQPLEVVTKVL